MIIPNVYDVTIICIEVAGSLIIYIIKTYNDNESKSKIKNEEIITKQSVFHKITKSLHLVKVVLDETTKSRAIHHYTFWTSYSINIVRIKIPRKNGIELCCVKTHQHIVLKEGWMIPEWQSNAYIENKLAMSWLKKKWRDKILKTKKHEPTNYLRCSRRIDRSCSICSTRRVVLMLSQTP